jgi:hypothetical protein
MLAKAVRHEAVPGFAVWILPYKPYYWQSQYVKFEAYLTEKGETLNAFHNMFILAVPLILDIEVNAEELPLWCEVFAEWYKDCTGDIVQDWQTFERSYPLDSFNELFVIYQATRSDSTLPKAPTELQKPAPVPVTDEGEVNPTIPPGGGKSKKNSSR